MRTIKELLELMLENKGLFTHGLCKWILLLYFNDEISRKEYLTLMNYIENNRPSILSSLNCFLSQASSAYYWKEGDIKPRIKWIQKHIKINS
jgi:hypothetical protein